MSFRHFNLCILVCLLVMLGSLIAMNVVIDPYGVLGSSSLPAGASSNERYLKLEHLKNNAGKYEQLMFASSRSGMTDPAWVESRTGLTTYNLSVFSGKPSDMEKLYIGFRVFSKAPVAVFVGVDTMAFMDEQADTDLSRRHHQDISSDGFVRYWLDYLLAPSLLPAIEKFTSRNSPPLEFNFSRGTYTLSGYERSIAADHRGYIEEHFSSWKPNNVVGSVDWSEMDTLKRWVSTLRSEGVEVKLFLQPMHHQWRKRMDTIYKEVEPVLKTLPEFINLSHISSNDNRAWYEQRHYRESVAREVVDQLYQNRIVSDDRGWR